MIEPILQRVNISDDKITESIHHLLTRCVLPDGTKVARDLRIFHKQLAAGYYHRLVWPPGTTFDDILKWHDVAQHILAIHKLGLV